MTKTVTQPRSPKRPPKLSPVEMAIYRALCVFVRSSNRRLQDKAIREIMATHRAEKAGKEGPKPSPSACCAIIKDNEVDG